MPVPFCKWGLRQGIVISHVGDVGVRCAIGSGGEVVDPELGRRIRAGVDGRRGRGEVLQVVVAVSSIDEPGIDGEVARPIGDVIAGVRNRFPVDVAVRHARARRTVGADLPKRPTDRGQNGGQCPKEREFYPRGEGFGVPSFDYTMDCHLAVSIPHRRVTGGATGNPVVSQGEMTVRRMKAGRHLA